MITFGLVAIAGIAGLAEPRAAGAAPPFLHEAFRNFRGGESEQGPEEPAAAFQTDGTELKLRAERLPSPGAADPAYAIGQR